MLHEELKSICKTLEKELVKVNESISKNGFSMSDLDYIDKLTHAIKSVKTTDAMIDSGMSHRMSRDNYNDNYNSNYNDNSYNRDSMGRYARDSHSMMSRLQDLRQDAPDNMRYEFDKFIERMKQM